MQNISTSELLFGMVLCLPLISFWLSMLIPERYAWFVSITAPVLLLTSAIISLLLFLSAENLYISWDWFDVGSYTVKVIFQLDSLSRLMIVTVTVISFLVHLYSTGYMAGDPNIKHYFAALGFFTFAMLGIVVAGNLMLLFLFWELVGFSSYLLIGYWIEKPQAARAAYKAFLYNRIGDAAMLLGIIMIWINTQSLDINKVITLNNNSAWFTTSGILIFCGVVAKSAQLPLFSWLPDAMEGPTPVSALLHAATLVAAGIFFLVRLFPFFTETVLVVITITGAITALSAAIGALHQFDIKKILAYSTISQLGLMVTAIGVGAKDAALLHLFTHAFFKAGLFLAAGSIIHVFHQYQQQSKQHFDVQDIRNLGGLKKSIPLTCIAFCIMSASLAGIPLFSGFISKDSILAEVWIWGGETFSLRWALFIVLLAVSFLTALYTFRMVWYIFFNVSKMNVPVTEAPWIMRAPVIVLAILSCGFLISVNPLEAHGWFTYGFTGIQHVNLVTALSAGVVLLAGVVAWIIYSKKPEPKASHSIAQGFKIDSFYQKTVGQAVLKLSFFTESVDKKWIDGVLHFTAYTQVSIAHGTAWFDRYIIDGLVNVGAWFVKLIGSFTRSFQGGKIQLYIFWAVTGIIIFLFFTLI